MLPILFADFFDQPAILRAPVEVVLHVRRQMSHEFASGGAAKVVFGVIHYAAEF